MTFFAHSAPGESESEWHTLREHLESTAAMSAAFAAPFGGERMARLAGLLHDLGKYNPAFQARLKGDSARVDHSTAGAHVLTEGVLKPSDPQDGLLARLVAYAIAGHHAGLADWAAHDRAASGSELRARLRSHDPNTLSRDWRHELSPDADSLSPPNMFEAKRERQALMASVLCRMVFSCLVDADYKDTEAYYARLEGRSPDRDWPKLEEYVRTLIDRLDAHMRVLELRASGAETSERQRLVGAERARIREHVRVQAARPPGLYTLTVPTGGGKTLASLGFALEHARIHRLRRVIYAIPFTSIIDQTASTFREILGEDYILEHHSAIESEQSAVGDSAQGPAKLRLAMEDWAAPIVVTTNVQLFESLFAARPSRCRKLHNIAGSVIVLDEAQALPMQLLAPCVRMIEELTVRYGCTVVLCTATQPALDRQHFPKPDETPLSLPLAGRELAPEPTELAARFRRVTVRLAGDMNDDALADELNSHEQGLVIVNSRSHARDLYERLKSRGLAGVMHLSTRQHAEDRRNLLDEIRQRLKTGRACRLVATSLVEAGVDIDFPAVWRAMTGLEQIAQSAGRCNREGRWPAESSIVTVFSAPDHPPPRALRRNAELFERVCARHADDLLSPAAITAYFKECYWAAGAAVEGKQILDLFKLDAAGFTGEFKTAAQRFQMIESAMVSIVVGNGQVDEMLSRLDRNEVRIGHAARAVQTRLVQVTPIIRRRLVEAGEVAFHNERRFGDQFAVLLRSGLYSRDVGLEWEQTGVYRDELIV